MIFGLEVKSKLPEGAIPLEAVAIIKYVASSGEEHWLITNTPEINPMERLGMLEAAVYTSKVDMHEAFEADDDEKS